MKGEEVSFSLLSQRFFSLSQAPSCIDGLIKTPARVEQNLWKRPAHFEEGISSGATPRVSRVALPPRRGHGGREAAIPHRAICEGVNGNNTDNNNKAVELLPARRRDQAVLRPQAGGDGDGRRCRPAAGKTGPSTRGTGRSALSLAPGPRRKEDGGC